MQIVITGHTSGIGKAVAEWAENKNWLVKGFSRSTGHPIESQEAQREILNATVEADVFFNNAHVGFYQVELAYKWFLQNQYQANRTMVVLGSRASDGIRYELHPYSVQKIALHGAIQQMQNLPHDCKVIHLRFGYVNTPAVEKVQLPKLDVSHVVQTIEWALNCPFYVREALVTIREKSTN